MVKVLGIPKNERWMLFNTIYHRHIDPKDKKSPDAITLILKNLDTGKKKIKTIKNPEIEIYMAKDHVDLGSYNHIDIPIDDVDVFDVSYKNRLRDMAALIGQENYYWNCIKQRRFDDLNQIMLYNRFFSADKNIEDFYMFKCRDYFGTHQLPEMHKSFLDIEADILKGYLDLKKVEGDAPINAITFIDDKSMTSYTVLLRDPTNPLVEEFEKDIPNFIEEITQEFAEEYGEFEFKIAMFDNEIELIQTIYALINEIKPDFCVAWNSGFDIPYIMHRIKKLGYDTKDIMCHKDFKFQECFYVKDTRNFEIKRKTDWCRMSSYTIFTDQMINYAAVRKSGAKIDSYKLDFIGEREANAKKLDYSDIGHIKYFPVRDYRRFVKYNINDVLVQWKIEKKVKDLNDVMYRAYTSDTRISKVFKESVFLTNVAFHDFREFGLILGNNVNAIKNQMAENENLFKDYIDKHNNVEDDDMDESLNEEKDVEEKKKEKFEGAIVGDPKLIMQVGLMLLGVKFSSSLFDDVVDFDFTSLLISKKCINSFNCWKYLNDESAA